MLHRMALKSVGIVPLPTEEFAGGVTHEGLQRVLPDWQFCPVPLLALFPSRLMSAKTRVFLDFIQTRLDLRNN
jgi:DNA-binding transcriptional LysR family regulator